LASVETHKDIFSGSLHFIGHKEIAVAPQARKHKLAFQGFRAKSVVFPLMQG
jgi:hypothetical protein